MGKIAEAVKDVVSMAATDKRLVLGAMPSAEFLGEEADSVALCLLLENKSDDVLISIQHKLVEAYCWENDIPLLKVDSEDKVRKILSCRGDQNNNEPDDLSCILVKVRLAFKPNIWTFQTLLYIHEILFLFLYYALLFMFGILCLLQNAEKMSSSESMLADFFDYIIKNEIEPFPVITLPEWRSAVDYRSWFSAAHSE